MTTFEYLFDADTWSLVVWPVLVGVAIGLMCGLLSVFVVLKRLSFIGQGVTHAGLGGIGIAAMLGVWAGGSGDGGLLSGLAIWERELALTLIIAGFCVLTALLIGWLSRRQMSRSDTAIGIVLVGSMALGVFLQDAARDRFPGARVPSWETVLFGSISTVGLPDVVTSWLIALLVCGVLWWYRRPMLFWAFDEPAARAFGVSRSKMSYALLVLIALAIVTAMRAAGVILATALLVLPGATGLQLSDRVGRVALFSVLVGVLGVVGGLVLTFERDTQAGASIVGALVGLFAVSWGVGKFRRAG